LRILILAHAYPPQQTAGAENYAHALARGLAARGHHVVAMAPQPGTQGEWSASEHEGVRVLRFGRDFRDLVDLPSTGGTSGVDSILQERIGLEAPDLLHVHHVAGSSARIARIAAGEGVPAVATLHDYWFQCGRGQRITPWGHVCCEITPARCMLCLAPKQLAYLGNALRGGIAEESPTTRAVHLPGRLIGRAWQLRGTRPIRRRQALMLGSLGDYRRLYAPSSFLLEEHVRSGVPRALLRLWEYGMDTDRFATPRRTIGTLAPPVRFGFIGSLLPSKGIELLLAALRRMPKGSCSLVVHGPIPSAAPGRRRVRLERAARGLPVEFGGAFAPGEIAAAYAGIDVLVAPSLWFENAPLTLLESVTAGVPAITADLGGMREFAERYGTALTFRPGDPAALAAAMRRFVDEPDLAAALVAARRREVRPIRDDVEATEREYAEILGSR
jgi:glycosyltransferase involved in cell wall biosynthesis